MVIVEVVMHKLCLKAVLISEIKVNKQASFDGRLGVPGRVTNKLPAVHYCVPHFDFVRVK